MTAPRTTLLPNDKAEVCHFDPEKHYAIVQEWARRRGMEFPTRELLPPRAILIGNNLSDQSDKVIVWRAALWYCVDPAAGWAWIPYLITNPASDLQASMFFIGRLMWILKRCVFEDGCRFVFATTRCEALTASAEKFGFKPLEKSADSLFADLAGEYS